MKEMKRWLAMILCFVMLIGVMPVNALAVEWGDVAAFFEEAAKNGKLPEGMLDKIPTRPTVAPETDPTEESTEAAEETEAPTEESTEATEPTEEEIPQQFDDGALQILALSDYSGSMSGVLEQVKAYNSDIDDLFFLGDSTDLAAMMTEAESYYTFDSNPILVQGDEDEFSSMISTPGPHDTDAYGVFVMNEREYQQYAKELLSALGLYLTKRVTTDYDKPVFVLSHRGLHDGTNNSYAKYVVAALNKAAEEGLEVVYLYGDSGENSLGEEVYLPKQSRINVEGEEKTLNFTYMNAGAASESMTVFSFDSMDNTVSVTRYDANGDANLKTAGTVDTTTAGSWAILGEPAMEDLLTDEIGITMDGVSTIITMSDYQNSSLSSDDKKTVPQTIVNAMVAAKVTPELALIGGDYTDGSVGADGDDQSQANLKTELGNLTGILTSAWSGLPYYAIQGNHDHSGFLTDGTLTATDDYEQDNYIVYLINEDSFPWWQGNYGSGSTTAEDKATVTATANDLSTYLDSLISANETRPVIIMSHVPMHWSERSTAANWYYDNIYANILFDAVNEAAKELDILFLFGHNHSSTASGGDYDKEIGGALSYVAKGESMKVPNGTDGTSNYTTKTLNFTYMNAGYVGNYAGDTSNTSIAAITIDSDSIDINRYTYNGNVVKETIALTGGDSSSESDSSVDTDSTATGEWVTIPGSDGSSTASGKFYHVTEELEAGHIYLLVSNDSYLKGIQDTGSTYTQSQWSYDTTIALQTMTTSSDSTGDYIETTNESLMWKAVASSIDGYFYLQNVKTGAYLRAGYLVDETYGRNINTTSSTSDTYTSFKAVSGSNYGIYAVQDSSSLSTNRWVRYSNSDSWYQGRTSYQNGAAQLWEAATVTSGEATPDTYARLTGEFVQNYDQDQQVLSEDYVLRNLKIETSTDGSTVAETISVTSDMVTWDKTFENKIGTYVGTVKYNGQILGTFTVNVTGTAEEVTGNGDWFKVADSTGGTTTYTYTQATSITAGEEYVIVANNRAVALMDNDGGMKSQSVTISGTTMTSTTALTEWTFSGSSSGTIYNGTRYLRGNNGSYSLNKNRSTLTFSANGSNFAISHSYRSGQNNYTSYFYYNDSSWTSNNSPQYVRLYQLTGSTTTGGTPETYARLTGTLEQVYSNADKTELSTVLGKVSIQTSTDQSNVASTVAVTSDMVTWDTEFDGSVAGVYTGTVTYEGQTLGTIKVTVNPVSVEKIELITAEGSVARGASSSTKTGGKIRITYSDGSTEDRDVVLGMVSNNGKVMGTYTGLTVTFGGKTVDGFTLTVTAKAGNNYPEYPKEGAVKVNKTATGIDFQSSGIAQVEISTSGIPMNQGVDVVVVLDTSSSMQETVEGFSSSRLAILRPAVNSLIEQLQTEREDGSDPDLDISIVCFNGFTGNGNSSTMYGAENYIEVQAYATPNAGGLLTDESGDGWVDIMDLSTNWADEDQGNIDTGSGTNYDEGLLLAYEQLSAKKVSWAEGETRAQFVVFMSDGAPFQYNGVYSNYTSTEWNNWLLGNYETEANIPSTVTNKEYYTGYAAGKGQEHRIAEAIKGDPDDSFDIVTTTADTNGATQMKSVAGMGATMYTIGYLLADNGEVTNETQDIVLENMASSSELYYDVDTAEELDDAFSNIASAVLMAATNARYVDQMGDNFDLQLETATYTVVDDNNTTDTSDDTTESKTLAPVIEVLAYDIYTKAEADANATDNITEDMIGDRKSSTPTILETVTFNADGTEAYSDQIYTEDAYGNKTYTNILIDGVICAKTFWYNTLATDVTLDDVKIPTGTTSAGLTTGTTTVLPSETFYWKIGTIYTQELAMRYYVYLEGSMEGTREGGSYATNEFATLYYDNYLGNPSYKDTVSPVMAWKQANVSYAFYLVDENGNIVVNQTTGQTGTFANKIAVTNPVVYETVLLNSGEKVSSIDIASLGVLPEGYELYDYDGTNGATYTVNINSNTTGSWTITTTKDVHTTYVTQYDPDNASAYSNVLQDGGLDDEGNQIVTGHDYTHTIVWFAVLWKVQALPDTVVIDYGLPVDISVLANDMFGENGKLAGVGPVANANLEGKDDAMNAAFKNEYKATDFADDKLSYGDVRIDATTGKVRYTLNSMVMDGYDKFAYAVNYTGSENAGYYYDTVTVIPATTIYYEDSFVSLKSYEWNSGWQEVALGNVWTLGEDTDAVQDEDRPGAYSLTDANNIYGFDKVNLNMATYSLASAAKATVDYDRKGTATFEFYGTGFDVISMTSNETGSIYVDVYNANDELIVSRMVDTYYGYMKGLYNVTYKFETVNVGTEEEPKYENQWIQYLGDEADAGATESKAVKPENPAVGTEVSGVEYVWVVNPNANNSLYQIPVMQVENLTYGKYKAVISVIYDPLYDNVENSTTYDFYLDAIRIYDPANDGAADGSEDTTIEDAYKADGEGWPSYIELRDNLIKADELGNADTDTVITGLVYIDGDAEVGQAQISDYISYGPNNEVYLDVGQSVAFILDTPDNIANVHIGVKSADGKVGSYTFTNIARSEKTADNGAKVNAGDTYGAKTSTINTTTDMYYDLTGWKNDIIVITNTGHYYDTEGIISLTNIKSTYTSDPNSGTEVASTWSLRAATAESAETYIYMTSDAATLTLRSLNGEIEDIEPEATEPETTVPEETEPEVTEPETTVPEESEPEVTEPETTVPEETEPEETKPQGGNQREEAIKQVVNTVKKVLQNLFGKWFR